VFSPSVRAGARSLRGATFGGRVSCSSVRAEVARSGGAGDSPTGAGFCFVTCDDEFRTLRALLEHGAGAVAQQSKSRLPFYCVGAQFVVSPGMRL
jgi:hypothetical protein